MSWLDSLFSDEGFDHVDTPEEGISQHKKRDTLKDAIQNWKSHFLPVKKEKWSIANIDRKTDLEVEKLYNIYMQRRCKSKVR